MLIIKFTICFFKKKVRGPAVLNTGKIGARTDV